jgi:hypothetical protein
MSVIPTIDEFRARIRHGTLEVLRKCRYDSPDPICFEYHITRDERNYFSEIEIPAIILDEVQAVIEAEELPIRHLNERICSTATRELVIAEIFGVVVRNSILQIWDRTFGLHAKKTAQLIEKHIIPHQEFKIIL